MEISEGVPSYSEKGKENRQSNAMSCFAVLAGIHSGDSHSSRSRTQLSGVRAFNFLNCFLVGFSSLPNV